MKIRITDLMDLYEDENCPLSPAADQSGRTVNDRPYGEDDGEIIRGPEEIRASRHAFGWKELASLAAALALVVLGGFGLRGLLTRSLDPGDEPSLTQARPSETHAPSGYVAEPLWGEEQERLSRLLTPRAQAELEGTLVPATRPCFALAESIVRMDHAVNFRVYAVLTEVWPDADVDTLPALSTEEADALAAEGKLAKLQTGTAVVRETEAGYELLDYGVTTLHPLNVSLTAQINPLLTAFAFQGVRDSNTDLAWEYEMAAFARRICKYDFDRNIVVRSDSTGSYETLRLYQVNEILARYLCRTVSPTEGTDYTELRGETAAQHETFHDGCFWWPAADGESYTRFALCTAAADTSVPGEGTSLFVTFQVYDAAPWEDRGSQIPYLLTREEAEALAAEGKLTRCESGCAWLRQVGRVLQLSRYLVCEPGDYPIETKNAPLAGTAWQTLTHGESGQLARELYLRSDGSFFYRDGAQPYGWSRFIEGFWEPNGDELILRFWECQETEPDRTGGPRAWPADILSARYACVRENGRLRLTQQSRQGLGNDQIGTELDLRFLSWVDQSQPAPQTYDPDSAENLLPNSDPTEAPVPGPDSAENLVPDPDPTEAPVPGPDSAEDLQAGAAGLYEAERPEGLELWLTQPVTDDAVAGMPELNLLLNGRLFLGRAYAPERSADGTVVSGPDLCVLYECTGYPDRADESCCVTRITVTDPEVSIYGMTAASSLEVFDQVFRARGWEVTEDVNAYIPRHVAAKDGITVRFSEGKLIFSVEVSNRENILF